ncbi:MAG: hypothetical protein NTZ26_14020 [Candidatus Aminicenantes bacterium]|nr:hypothetical protein [Candidatus Aminicenantes bacterium]
MKKIPIALLAILALSLAGYAGQDRKGLKVKVLPAEVRATPDVTGKVIFRIDEVKTGGLLEYKAKVGSWYQILLDPDNDDSLIGYIAASFVDEVVVKITEQDKYETAERQITKIAQGVADCITDNSLFPVLEKPEDCLLKKESLLYKALVPKYTKYLPLTDPWGEPYEIFLGNNAWGKVNLEYFGIQEIVGDEFLVVSRGKSGLHEKWKYDPKSPEAGLYSEFDARKNIISFNGKMIRGIKK